MEISDREQRAGVVWGALALAAGITLAWLLVEPGSNPSRSNRATWLFLSAHYINVGPMNVDPIVNGLPRMGIVSRGDRSLLWHSIPIFTTALCATGINMGLGRTTDPKLILRDSGLLLIGYLPVFLIAAVWSGAAGAAGWLIAIIAGAFLALAIGSQTVGRATPGTPVLAITSLGGLVVIGLVVLLGGLFILQMLIPVAVVAGGGAVLGSGVVYSARTYT